MTELITEKTKRRLKEGAKRSNSLFICTVQMEGYMIVELEKATGVFRTYKKEPIVTFKT